MSGTKPLYANAYCRANCCPSQRRTLMQHTRPCAPTQHVAQRLSQDESTVKNVPTKPTVCRNLIYPYEVVAKQRFSMCYMWKSKLEIHGRSSCDSWAKVHLEMRNSSNSLGAERTKLIYIQTNIKLRIFRATRACRRRLQADSNLWEADVK